MEAEASEAAAGSGASRRSSRRLPSALRRLTGVGIVVAIVYFLGLPQIAGPVDAIHLVGSANLAYVAIAALLEVGSIACYALFTRSLIHKRAPGIWTIFRIDMATMAVSHVLPAGSLGGGGLGYKLLRESGTEPREAGFVVATQGIASALVLNALLWVALVISVPLRGFNPLYRTAAISGAVLFAAFGLLVLGVVRETERGERALRAVARVLPLLREEMVAGLVELLAARLRLLASDRSLFGRTFGWAALNWIGDAASLWVFLLAFGHHLISPIPLIVAYGVANVLAAIPITPSGLGVIETVLPSMLVGFGMTRGVALIGVLAWRLFNFWLPIPAGAAAYLSLHHPASEGRPRRGRIAELERLARQEGDKRRFWLRKTTAAKGVTGPPEAQSTNESQAIHPGFADGISRPEP